MSEIFDPDHAEPNEPIKISLKVRVEGPTPPLQDRAVNAGHIPDRRQYVCEIGDQMQAKRREWVDAGVLACIEEYD